jgi:hypothetical protein
MYRPAGPQAGGIDSLESIPGLLKRLQIRALFPMLQTLGTRFPSIENFVHAEEWTVLHIVLNILASMGLQEV